MAEFEDPRAEKLIFSDKTSPCTIDCALKHTYMDKGDDIHGQGNNIHIWTGEIIRMERGDNIHIWTGGMIYMDRGEEWKQKR